MNSLQVEVAIIGAGTAGLAAYRAARARRQRVLLIEDGIEGTTCARVGCMPSKLLIAAADVAHGIAGAERFGVRAGSIEVDGAAVMRRVRSERDRFVDFVLERVAAIPAAERLRGRAQFLDGKRLQVGEHTEVQADSIVLASGSSAVIPPLFQKLGTRVLGSDAVFEWQQLPSSLAVVGTGAIGLELGQALQRLGVRVTLFGRSRIAQLSDPEVQGRARSLLAEELDLRLGAEIVAVEPDGDGVALQSRSADGQLRTEHFNFVLCTTGRAPNVRQLGLERAGIALDQHGVPLFDPATMRCGDSSIFVAGDASDERPLLHEASAQGRIAGDNAGVFPDRAPGARYVPLSIVFSDPQIAMTGRSWRSLKSDALIRFAAGAVDFENQGRSRVMLQNRGLLRVYGELGSERFLGAEMIGPRAEHLIHLLAWACQSRMTVSQMLDMPYYHPVIEEGLRTALRDLQGHLQSGLAVADICCDCTPGT